MSWLIGRNQRVTIKDRCSPWIGVESGVPQGSVLGPLLFNIFINDLSQNVNSPVLHFADDTKLFRKISGTEDAAILQTDLDSALKWATENRMEFNTSKCKAMRCARLQVGPSYHLGNALLENVNVMKDLGVHVDRHLRFHSHSLLITGQARQLCGMIKRKFVTSDPKLLVRAFSTYVRPVLEYATQVWNPGLIKSIVAIEKVQRWFTKSLRGQWNVPYSERLEHLSLNTLELRRLFFDMRLFHIYFHEGNGPEWLQKSRLRGRAGNLPHTRGTTDKRAEPPLVKSFAKINSFFIRSCQKWNTLPLTLRESSSAHQFSEAIKKIKFTDFLRYVPD